ncbi:TonB-dependent siderophore receptor [Alloalcanivorax mobilis]|uniref:TonB-dependent siderophore receptor n=1 Tax=Alloalcanivorax mobilis TaxID=2019569 RepID=UPI001E48183C|nr:TonB-dependent siderophore receptor [Alloalcanivorax mobilis]
MPYRPWLPGEARVRVPAVPAFSMLALLTAPVFAADVPQANALPAVDVEAQAPAESDYINAGEAASTGKLDVPLQDTPFSISVVGREFIEDTGAKNIQDTLTYTSGVYAGNFGLDTRGDSAKVRGLNPSSYLDGLRNLYGSYNNVRPEVYGLERVEVLKGPSSTLYGQAELGGIINAVSKLPKPVKQGELWAQGGSFGRKQLAGDVTGPLSEDGKLLYRLVALKRESGTQVDHVDDNGYLFAPSLTWLPTDNTTVSLLFNSQQNDGGVSAQFLPSVGTLYDGPKGHIPTSTFVGEPGWDRYDRKKNEVTLFVDHRFNDHWGVATTARYSKSETETREHWTQVGATLDADGNMARTIYMDDKNTEVKNVDVRLKGNIAIGATRHTLALGVDRQDALWEQDNVFSGAGTDINVYNPVYGDVNYAELDPQDANDNEIKQTGVYLIDHMEIGRMVVSGALRYDDSSSRTLGANGVADTRKDDTATTGRLGLMYRFDSGIAPYISYSEAFVPNLGTNTAGEGLDPTTGKQKEAGVKYLSPEGSLEVTAAWFDIEQENQVFPDPQSPLTQTQTGAVVDGWELQVKKRLGNVELLANYTRLDAKDDSTGVRLPYVAEETASGWARYEMENGLRFGAGVRYVGDNVGSGGGPTVPSVTLVDALVGYTTGPWDFSVNAQNLGDEEYVSWCRGEGFDCGYGERRVINGNVRYRF